MQASEVTQTRTLYVTLKLLFHFIDNGKYLGFRNAYVTVGYIFIVILAEIYLIALHDPFLKQETQQLDTYLPRKELIGVPTKHPPFSPIFSLEIKQQ